jgi:hypothetical protein
VHAGLQHGHVRVFLPLWNLPRGNARREMGKVYRGVSSIAWSGLKETGRVVFPAVGPQERASRCRPFCEGLSQASGGVVRTGRRGRSPRRYSGEGEVPAIYLACSQFIRNSAEPCPRAAHVAKGRRWQGEIVIRSAGCRRSRELQAARVLHQRSLTDTWSHGGGLHLCRSPNNWSSTSTGGAARCGAGAVV